jgi:hypothetical protein
MAAPGERRRVSGHTGRSATTLVSNQVNSAAAGLAVGNDGLLYGMTGTGGPFGF